MQTTYHFFMESFQINLFINVMDKTHSYNNCQKAIERKVEYRYM